MTRRLIQLGGLNGSPTGGGRGPKRRARLIVAVVIKATKERLQKIAEEMIAVLWRRLHIEENLSDLIEVLLVAGVALNRHLVLLAEHDKRSQLLAFNSLQQKPQKVQQRQ